MLRKILNPKMKYEKMRFRNNNTILEEDRKCGWTDEERKDLVL